MEPGVPYPDRNWLDMDLGAEHTCGIDSNSTVYCWGRGSEGQLGNGSTADVSVPTVRTGTMQAGSIEAGTQFTMVSTIAGTIMTWGLNSQGQLGNGTTTSRPTPVQILP